MKGVMGTGGGGGAPPAPHRRAWGAAAGPRAGGRGAAVPLLHTVCSVDPTVRCRSPARAGPGRAVWPAPPLWRRRLAPQSPPSHCRRASVAPSTLAPPSRRPRALAPSSRGHAGPPERGSVVLSCWPRFLRMCRSPQTESSRHEAGVLPQRGQPRFEAGNAGLKGANRL